jgi:hypothetical protein
MITDAYRMERLLEVWEDAWYLFTIARRISLISAASGKKFIFTKDKKQVPLENEGPTKHWRDFREYLKNETARYGAGEVYTDCRFISGNRSWAHIQALDNVARDLHGWCLTSKRVFALAQDLQILLGATAVDSVKWSEIEFPFPCFALRLAEPIVHKDQKYDLLLVRYTKVRGQDGLADGISVTLVQEGVRTYSAITATERKAIRNALDMNELRRAANLTQTHIGKRFHLIPQTFDAANLGNMSLATEITIDTCLTPLAIDADKVTDETASVMTKILRLIGGFCLYLKTLPVKSPHINREITPGISGVRGPAVTDNQELLLLTSENTLSDEDRAIFRDLENEEPGSVAASRKRGEYLKPRYRSGYWHRPLGKGDDPLYPKTEWTRPTIARKDLRNRGILPEGSQTNVA